MSEESVTETESTVTDETESTESVPFTIDDDDELAQGMIARLEAQAKMAEPDIALIKSAESDDLKILIHEKRKEHKDWPKVEKLQEQILALETKIDEENTASGVVTKPSDEDVAAAKERLEVINRKAKGGIAFLVSSYGDEALSLVPESIRPKRKGPVGDVKRPRLSAITVKRVGSDDVIWKGETGPDVKPENVSTFTNLAKFLSKDSEESVTTKVLQSAAFAEAKTEDLSTVDGVVEFAQTVGEKHYMIALQAKTK